MFWREESTMDGGLLATLLCFCAHSWNSMRFRPQCLDYHGEATSLLRDAASENVSTIWIHKPPEEEDRSDCDCNDAESEIESVSVGASNFDRSSRDMERANEPKQHRGCISTGEAAIATKNDDYENMFYNDDSEMAQPESKRQNESVPALDDGITAQPMDLDALCYSEETTLSSATSTDAAASHIASPFSSPRSKNVPSNEADHSKEAVGRDFQIGTTSCDPEITKNDMDCDVEALHTETKLETASHNEDCLQEDDEVLFEDVSSPEVFNAEEDMQTDTVSKSSSRPVITSVPRFSIYDFPFLVRILSNIRVQSNRRRLANEPCRSPYWISFQRKVHPLAILQLNYSFLLGNFCSEVQGNQLDFLTWTFERSQAAAFQKTNEDEAPASAKEYEFNLLDLIHDRAGQFSRILVETRRSRMELRKREIGAIIVFGQNTESDSNITAAWEGAAMAAMCFWQYQALAAPNTEAKLSTEMESIFSPPSFERIDQQQVFSSSPGGLDCSGRALASGSRDTPVSKRPPKESSDRPRKRRKGAKGTTSLHRKRAASVTRRTGDSSLKRPPGSQSTVQDEGPSHQAVREKEVREKEVSLLERFGLSFQECGREPEHGIQPESRANQESDNIPAGPPLRCGSPSSLDRKVKRQKGQVPGDDPHNSARECTKSATASIANRKGGGPNNGLDDQASSGSPTASVALKKKYPFDYLSEDGSDFDYFDEICAAASVAETIEHGGGSRHGNGVVSGIGDTRPKSPIRRYQIVSDQKPRGDRNPLGDFEGDSSDSEPEPQSINRGSIHRKNLPAASRNNNEDVIGRSQNDENKVHSLVISPSRIDDAKPFESMHRNREPATNEWSSPNESRLTNTGKSTRQLTGDHGRQAFSEQTRHLKEPKEVTPYQDIEDSLSQRKRRRKESKKCKKKERKRLKKERKKKKATQPLVDHHPVGAAGEVGRNEEIIYSSPPSPSRESRPLPSTDATGATLAGHTDVALALIERNENLQGVELVSATPDIGAPVKLHSNIPNRSQLPESNSLESVDPPIQLLCSETFLETWGLTIGELASGEWAESLVSEPQIKQGQAPILPSTDSATTGRKITFVDTSLVETCGIDIELPNRGGIIVSSLSSWRVDGVTRSLLQRILDLAVTSRYSDLHIIFCADVEVNSSIARKITKFHTVLMRQNGKPSTGMHFSTVSPRSLSTCIAQAVLASNIRPQQNMEDVEACLGDDRTRERINFLLSLIPTITLNGALQCLRLGSIVSAQHEISEESSKTWFQNLVGKSNHERKRIRAMVQSMAPEAQDLHPDALIQLAYVVNVSLGKRPASNALESPFPIHY